jgi:hypothetical protein
MDAKVMKRKRILWCSGEYYATDEGHILSSKSGQYLKGTDTNGYLYVGLRLPGERKFKRYAIHRIVCEAFHGTPEIGNTGAPHHVNHKDGNKRNNRPENLEWCTQLENNRHAWETGLTPYIGDFAKEQRCPIIGVGRDGQIYEYYESIKEAARNGHNEAALALRLRNPSRYHHGLMWRRMYECKIIL